VTIIIIGDKMNNLKHFNIYILISSFSKALIEVFIPIILYKSGFKIHEIILFFLIKSVFIFIFNSIVCIIGSIIRYKWLDIISIIFFYLGYSYLFHINNDITSLFKVSVLLVIYEHSYWVSRHYHALNILNEEKIATEIGNFLIMTQLALIPASFIGALLLENLNVNTLLLIIFILLFISSIITFKMNLKERVHIKNYTNEITKVIKNIPNRDLLFFILEQFRVVGNFFFPLYLYIYVSKNMNYIGIFNIVVGIASIIFIYLFSRKMEKSKKDYIIMSSLFVSVIWLFKLNIHSSILMLLIALLQGLSDRMYELSSGRNIYSLGKNYSSILYIMVTEGIYNVGRIFICLIGFSLLTNFKLFLYLCGIMVFVAGMVGFKNTK
jgi:hypothetical protein